MNFTSKKELYAKLLDNCREGNKYILTSHKIHKDILTIHNMPNPKHFGFGYFSGTTINGYGFQFQGGGALRKYTLNDKHHVSWCFLESQEIGHVVEDLEYDYFQMIGALQSLAQ